MRSTALGMLARVSTVVALCAGTAWPGAAQTAPREPVRIHVVGTDYAFLPLPATLAPGKTLFSFENRGKVRHELSIALLRPGVTLQQMMQVVPGSGERPGYIEKVVGILIAKPGDTSGGELLADLLPGRRYLVRCSLRDTPDAAPHHQLGMVTVFDVQTVQSR